MDGVVSRAFLLTFTDLTALLLAFFVLVYAMTSIDRTTLHRVAPLSTPISAAASGPAVAGIDPPGLSAARVEELGRLRADYLLSVLDRDLAEVGRPCGLVAQVRGARAELQVRSLAEALEAAACMEALRRAGQIFARLAAGRPDALILQLPAAPGENPVAALARAERSAQAIANILGSTPILVVPLVPRGEPIALLRLEPL